METSFISQNTNSNMFEQQIIAAQSFEDEKDESKLLLILDDIEASKKQIESLEKEKKSLTKDLNNLTFNLDELKVKKNLLTSISKPLASNEATNNSEEQFFSFFNSLENREAEIEGRLEGNRELTANLNHQLNQLQQKNKNLKNELKRVEQEATEEEDSFTVSNNNLVDLNIKLDEITKENEFLLQKCEELKNELQERDSHLKGEVMVQYEELTARYKKGQQELEDLKKQSENKKKELNRSDKKLQEKIDLKKKEISQGLTINQWRTDRSVLKDKLKNYKTQLFSIQKNLDDSKRRDDDLEEKYNKLLGENHNFGQCDLAKKCLISSINHFDEEKEAVTSSKDYDYEIEYTKQLTKEQECIDKSLEIFRQYRDNQINSLNQELKQCSNYGFLILLKEELEELQRHLLSLQ